MDISEESGRRADGRAANELRPLRFETGIAPHAQGSCLVQWGKTQVICAVTVEESVPRWMKFQNVKGGWITAEYSMLPYSTLSRKARDSSKGRPDGRSTEIQRLIGRSIRAVIDLDKLGERTLWLDCDVLQADGGTRTASITGAHVALQLALHQLQSQGKIQESPMKCGLAAVSLGIVEGRPLLDLCYTEDAAADVDLNLVMTHEGRFVELQASGEEATFSPEELQAMMDLGRGGIETIRNLQNEAIQAALS